VEGSCRQWREGQRKGSLCPKQVHGARSRLSSLKKLLTFYPKQNNILNNMGWIFQRRVKLFGGLGLNFSKSGIGWSIRTGLGSIGSKGYSIRTGITGLYYRVRYRSPQSEAAQQRKLEKLQAKVEKIESLSNELETFDFSLNENHIPNFWAKILKDFKHIKIVHVDGDNYRMSAEGMDTEDGTAQNALVELSTLKSEFKRMKSTLQTLKKMNPNMEIEANKMIWMMDSQFTTIKTIENYIKKALKIS
jgi:hypothetical protein